MRKKQIVGEYYMYITMKFCLCMFTIYFVKLKFVLANPSWMEEFQAACVSE